MLPIKQFINTHVFTIIILSIITLPSTSEKFACNHTFRTHYSLFMITSSELQYNKIPLTMYYNGIERIGILFFNMCEEIQLTNVCGKTPIIGNFIFVDNVSRVGRAKCLTFQNLDNYSWNFSAISEEGSVQNARGGIRIQNDEVGIKETEVLDRATLEGLDVGSIVMGEEPSNFDNSRVEFMRNAIDQKLLNLQKKSSSITKLEIDLHRQPTFKQSPLHSMSISTNKIMEYDTNSAPQRNGSKRFLEQTNNLKMSVNSKVDLDEAFSKVDIRPMLKKHLTMRSNDKTTVEMLFFCNRDGPSTINANYSNAASKLEIKINSIDGCVTELTMLQWMSIIPIISAIFFSLFGIVFLYGGFIFKVYFKVIFIVLCQIFLYFSLYFLFIESLSTQTLKITFSIVLLSIIIGLSILTYFFDFVFYIQLAFLGATNFGLIVKLALQEYSLFFFAPFSEWWLIVLFWSFFFLMFVYSKDFFVIGMTSILGTTLSLISLRYFGVTDYDFLFNTQVEKFDTLNEIDPENVKFAGIYFVAVLTGVIIQWALRRRYKSSQDEIDLLNESGRKVAVNFDNI